MAKKPQAKTGPESEDAKTVPGVTESEGQAKTVPESDNIMTFDLPPVSDTAGDFIDDEAPPADTDTPGDPDAPDEQQNQGEQYRGAPDDKGHPYDPAVHSYPPEKTGKLGKWKKKPKAQQGQTDQGQKVEHNAAYRRQAGQYAAMYAHAHVTVFGPDGTLDKEALVPLTDAIEQYFIENGLKDLPAGAAVALSAFNYSATIASRENNKVKVARWFNISVGWIKGLFGFKPKAEPENKEAQSA